MEEHAARVYQEMLAELDIRQVLCEMPENEKTPETNYPTCCTGDTNDILISDGAYICWQCGYFYGCGDNEH